MTKKEFIKEIAERNGSSQKEVKEMLEDIQSVVFAHLKDEDGVKPFDGVKFEAVYKEAHYAKNPKTGEEVRVEAKYKPRAKFGKAIKEYLND